MSRPVAKITPRVVLSVQLPLVQGIEVDAIAQLMGLSRHRLITLAVKRGLPLIVPKDYQFQTDIPFRDLPPAAELPTADPPAAA